MSNIKVVDDQFFKVNNKIFYHIFSEVDLLITDFSSVFIDFMLTQKPIIFFVDDFEMYKKSRGFIFDNLDDLLPGEIIKSFSKLESVIENFDFDNYEFNYKISIDHFHDVKSNFSHNLYEHISGI
jgi:CDP-glycerol glycerophosphotransferase (TagB/SpsB family)